MSPQNVMAPTNLERKLERLFSRRKPHTQTPNVPPSPAESIQEEPLFPSPSFIRPKTSRMMARDEAPATLTPARRARSVPDALPNTKHICRGHSKTGSTSTTGSSIASVQTYPHLPRRSSSLCRRRDATLVTLTERQFQPFPPAPCDQRWTPPSSASPTRQFQPFPPAPCDQRWTPPSSASPTRQFSRQAGTTSSTASNVAPVQRLDTPPPSDGEEAARVAPLKLQKKTVPGTPVPQPTPEPSPELFPLPNKTLKSVAATQLLGGSNYTKLVSTVATGTGKNRCPKMHLRKTVSTSSLVPARRARLSEILDEPTFGDFMALSDDDIAESRPDSPLLGETDTDSSCNNTGNGGRENSGGEGEVGRQEPVGSTSSPLLAAPVVRQTAIVSRRDHTVRKMAAAHQEPAAAAAFEAARIASRYGFDLVYVVSLWPKDKDASASSPPSSPSSSRHSSRDNHISYNDAIINQSSGMNGRLLAAYGLGAIKSPFKISTAVHQKILGNEGWIEYRNSNASPDEFARGYACSFYGSSVDGSQRGSQTSAAPREGCFNNRGTVFAAYRRPRNGANVGCEGHELGCLHVDAKKLVDMLLAAPVPPPSPKSKTYSPFPAADRISRTPLLTKRPTTATTTSSLDVRTPLH